MTTSIEPPDLVATVERRVVDHELATRLGHTPPNVPDPREARGLPPFTALAWRAIPSAVVERRSRFLYAVGWLQAQSEQAGAPRPQRLPPEATLEDLVAAILDAGETATRAPALLALIHGYVHPDPDDVERLDRFFDDVADTENPAWRTYRPTNPEAAPTWARVEAATAGADRWFGRSRSQQLWSDAAHALWRAAEVKRRRWG